MRLLLLQTVSPTIVQNAHYIYHLCIRAVGQFYQTTNRLSHRVLHSDDNTGN